LLLVSAIFIQVVLFGEFKDDSGGYAGVDAVVFEDTGRVVVGGEAFICFLFDRKMGLDTVLVE
jgi:hypothetical protein